MDRTPIVRRTDFDYVIVGGGSAGGWIARRLATSNLGSVAIIEAGPRTDDVRTVVPNWYPKTFGTSLDWNLTTEPQAGLSGRRIPWPRGRLLGGSGAINAMIYLQPSADDLNRWGWDWAPALVDSSSGTSPLLYHASPSSPHPWSERFVSAAVEAGLQYVAPWTQSTPDSCGMFATAVHQGKRVHTGQGLEALSNLQILSQCQATHIELQGQRAVAVHVEHTPGESERLAARQAIVLCAGVVGTPQLLWQSGIGPSKQLSDLSIECHVDLPAVGENLQDHLAFPVVFETTDAVGLARRSTVGERNRYRSTGKGLLASNIAEAGALLSFTESQHPACSSPSDVQIHFTATHYLRYPRLASTTNYMSLTVTDLHPRSRGALTFQVDNSPSHTCVSPQKARLKPVIDPHYLIEADDLTRICRGVDAAREIAAQPSLRSRIKSELLPGARRADCQSMERSIRSLSQSMFHPIGTCRMQSQGDSESRNSVVDGGFRVHGVTGLRIADASVIPDLPSGNTNATTLMIAARLCQLLEREAAASSVGEPVILDGCEMG